MEEESKKSPLLTYWYTGIAFFSLAVISSSGASAASDIESLNAPLSYWYIPILVFLIFAGASWKSFWGKPSFIKNWIQILLMSFLSIFFCRGGIYYWANCHFDSSGNSAILTLSERTHSSGSDSANYYLIFDQTDIFYDKAKVQVSEELFSTGKAGKEYEIQYGNGLIGLKWIHSVREIPDDRPSLIKDPPIVQEIEPQYAPVHHTGVFKMNLFSNEKRENRYEYTYNGLLTNASSTALKKYSIEVEAVSEDGGFFIKESVPLIQESSVPLQPSDTINVEFTISNLTKENVSGSLKHIRITQKEILTVSPAKRKSGKKVDYIWFVSDEEKAA
ncbi:MAG: hypothetical protein VX278_24000, partial [Myxococcota bacterium]|nr:hypothetical protein [Myxococcota bacterium]